MEWSLDNLASVLDAMREGVQVIDPELRYVYLNRAAAEHGRSTSEALVGRRMSDCYPGIELTSMYALLTRCLVERRSDRMVNQFIHPDGSTAWFELRFEPVPQGLVIMSIDITEQRALETELQRARRLESLGRLAGGIAHDFNNLLTVFTGYSSFIQMAVPEGSRAHEDATVMLAAAGRGASLTAQLLAFSSARKVNPGATDVAAVAGRVLDMLGRVLGEGVVLVRSVAPGLPNVNIDTGALEQIVMNLVLNARDAMEGVGTLTVETRATESVPETQRGELVEPGVYVLLAVTDTGSGMTPEVVDQVFEPFFTTKRERGGTGLGLATVFGLVSQAGGHIRVYSEVGHGTTFRVYFPTNEVALRPRADEPDEAVSRGTERVLVVDDDPAVLSLAKRSLESLGYTVEAVGSAAEAQRLLEWGHFSLLVTDMVLPGLTGAELARFASALRPGHRTLFISGYTERALRAQAEELDVLEKPFHPDQLARRVRSALDRP
ncbi:MAG: ATP-binding protein [Pseudomonadota bacterium]|nr:ATP-binding protein [Pseudomonadota bacterium]